MKKYSQATFDREVETYKKTLKGTKGKNCFIILDPSNEKAFYSLAPLSCALHELDWEVNISSKSSANRGLAVIKDAWTTYSELKEGKKTHGAAALSGFVAEVKKEKKLDLMPLFAPPDIILTTEKSGFFGSGVELPFLCRWFKPYRWNELVETCEITLRECYAPKKSETVSIGFELIPRRKELELPLEDYLDSFPICYAMKAALKGIAYVMSSSSSKKSQLEPMERIGDLKTMLLGCEFCKESKEPIFVAFKALSKAIRSDRMKVADAAFGVRGKGYGGTHRFGQQIGYPSRNGKTRWSSPGAMAYKFDWYPQTKDDDSMPQSRISFTETLPIDIFIETLNIDWKEMRRKNDLIKRNLERCDRIEVEPGIAGGTRCTVYLTDGKGKRRWLRKSEAETTTKLNEEYYKKTGIKAGNMGNLPSGEIFTTPESIDGMFVGDVVISLDQSYTLSAKEPMVVSMKKGRYTVVSGPSKILSKFSEKKKEAWKLILEKEKYKSEPAEIIRQQKDNFDRIGEFAINTNPKARLCRYLIVNEKIADMIHIAMGSGFEDDRNSTYHTDVVIDAKRQKLDIYGVEKNGKRHWVLKKGRFAA